MTALTRVTDPGVLAIPASLISPTALCLPEDADLSLDAGLGLLRQCGVVENGSRFWQGDLFLWLERHYPDELHQALSPEEFNLLRPYIWVSERCPPEIRHASWSHCRAVGAVPEAEREGWLIRADSEGWSVRDLKAALAMPAEGLRTSDKGLDPKVPRKIDKEGVLSLSHERIGATWTADDDLAVRAALGMD